MKPVALVDLDGTLADFHGAMQRDLRKMLGPDELPLLDAEDEDEHPHVKARRDFIKRSPDWWYNLEPIAQGFCVVEMLRELDFRIHICTRGPKKNAMAWEQKVRWCQRHIPDASITITLDKSLTYGRVLIDDWPSYVKPWLKVRPRGLVVMPDRTWNRDFVHERYIRHTNNDAEVFAALKVQRDRK